MRRPGLRRSGGIAARQKEKRRKTLAQRGKICYNRYAGGDRDESQGKTDGSIEAPESDLFCRQSAVDRLRQCGGGCGRRRTGFSARVLPFVFGAPFPISLFNLLPETPSGIDAFLFLSRPNARRSKAVFACIPSGVFLFRPNTVRAIEGGGRNPAPSFCLRNHPAVPFEKAGGICLQKSEKRKTVFIYTLK